MKIFLPNSQERNRELALASLSSREWEVLLLLAEGKTNAEIADDIYVTIKSLHNNKNRISNKLGLNGYRALSKFATEHRQNLNYWSKVLENKTNSEKLKAVFYRLGSLVA